MKIEEGRRVAGAMSASLATHGVLFLLLLLLLTSRGLDTSPAPAMPVSLKYINVAGIGGGGGGSDRPVVAPRPASSKPVVQPLEHAPAPAPIALSLVSSTLPPDIPGAVTGLSSPIALAPGNPGGSGTPGAGAGEGDGPGKGKGRGGNEGGDVYGPGDPVTIPVLIYEKRPTYTNDAMQKRITGFVELDAVVMADGSVAEPRIVRSLDPGLDRRAIDAVLQWRFRPGRHRETNQPVNVLVRFQLEFLLR